MSVKKYSALFRWEYLWKFGSVGAMGGVVDNLVLAGLVEIGKVSPILGKVLSAEASIIFMFVLNEVWTFSNHGERTVTDLGWRLVMSNIIRLGGLGVGIFTMYVLWGLLDVWYLLSNILGIGVGFVVNYACECLFTWDIVGD